MYFLSYFYRYGDKFPRSVGGRIIGIICITIGCVIVPLYTSTVTSHLTTEVVAEKMKLYGMKVRFFNIFNTLPTS